MKGDPDTDPKGLILESYRIEGITMSECRTIFLDWALSLPDRINSAQAMKTLLERHAEAGPDHPMSAVLREGLEKTAQPKRRGGWRSRDRG